MKISNPAFLVAKKSKDITLFTVSKKKRSTYGINEEWDSVMRITISHKQKFTQIIESINIETAIEASIVNYSFDPHCEILEICFTRYVQENECHIRTFLNALNKDSELFFKVIAFSTTESVREKGLVGHDLYGIINGKSYFLESFVGADNYLSPVKY